MAISFVGNVSSGFSSNATTIAVTVPAAGVPVGDFLIAVVGRSSAETGSPTIADTKGNTWVQLRVTIADDPCQTIWMSKITVALVSGNTITATYAAMAGRTMSVDQFTGVAAATADTASQRGTGTSVSPSVGPWTPSTLALVYGATYWQSSTITFTGDSDSDGGDTWHSLTLVTNTGVARQQSQYKIITSIANLTYNPSLSLSAVWGNVIAGVQGPAASRQPRGPAVNFTTTAVL